MVAPKGYDTYIVNNSFEYGLIKHIIIVKHGFILKWRELIQNWLFNFFYHVVSKYDEAISLILKVIQNSKFNVVSY